MKFPSRCPVCKVGGSLYRVVDDLFENDEESVYELWKCDYCDVLLKFEYTLTRVYVMKTTEVIVDGSKPK